MRGLFSFKSTSVPRRLPFPQQAAHPQRIPEHPQRNQPVSGPV
jgi:hypothetical protein